MKQKPDNSTIWNRAAVLGLAFGAISTACLVCKYISMLRLGEHAMVQNLVNGLLWAAEFFGCIFLMRSCIVSFRMAWPGSSINDAVKFGRRIALLSGLILASAEAISIMNMPQEEINASIESIASDMSSRLGSQEREQLMSLSDYMPQVMFFSQWLYCFLYGALLSSALATYIYSVPWKDSDTEDDDDIKYIDNQ